MLFTELGLQENTLKGIHEVGYQTPTPIQAQVIPNVLQKRDVFGTAQTGTGKTASYTLPLLDLLAGGRARARMPRILILTPTRELAYQVVQSFATYGKYHKCKVVMTIGGESIYEQERKLLQGADVLIATPGRLLDLYERGKIMLLALEIVVIDEADRMLDMGFIPDIERIFAAIPAKRQTLMFSATVPHEIRRLSETFLHDFVEVTVTPQSRAAETVQQHLIRTDVKSKRQVLRTIIEKEQVKNAIIFCNRKKDIGILCTSLNRHKYNAAPLHGDLHQLKRTETLNAFKQGQLNFLVASDVAARGIDVEDLDFVFNFDVPTNAEEYVHRIGRTGRAGRAGQAFTFATKEEAAYLKAIQNLLKIDIPEYSLPETPKIPKPVPEENLKKSPKQSARSKSSSTSKSLPRNDSKPLFKSLSNEPVIGFGEMIPAFMNNYFPELKSRSVDSLSSDASSKGQAIDL